MLLYYLLAEVSPASDTLSPLLRPSCVAECDVGRFGEECLQQCDCENGGRCDRRTGRCRCSAGWIGERCERGERTRAAAKTADTVTSQEVQFSH